MDILAAINQAINEQIEKAIAERTKALESKIESLRALVYSASKGNVPSEVVSVPTPNVQPQTEASDGSFKQEFDWVLREFRNNQKSIYNIHALLHVFKTGQVHTVKGSAYARVSNISSAMGYGKRSCDYGYITVGQLVKRLAELGVLDVKKTDNSLAVYRLSSRAEQCCERCKEIWEMPSRPGVLAPTRRDDTTQTPVAV